MKKVDANQNDIVRQLRQIGASVAVTSMLGHGFPDIVVGYRGLNFLIELKDGNKVPSAQKLTPDENTFHYGWRGQIAVCNSFDQVLNLITSVRK